MKTTIKNYGEENFIAQAVTRYLPYWPLFLVLMILTLDGAWAYLYITNPMYESSARILIKDEKKGAEDSKTEEGLNLLSPKRIIENEMDVIQSRTLLDEVVRDLDLFIPVTEESRFRKHPAYLTSPVKIEGVYSPGAAVPAKIYFTYDVHEPAVIINHIRYPLEQWLMTPMVTEICTQ